MNIEKFTKKALESIELSQKIAINNGNQEVKQIHLLKGLIDVEDSLLKDLFFIRAKLGKFYETTK